MHSQSKGRTTMLVIYHNPRCSKSRETLTLLKNQGLQQEIRHYLEHPPSAAELSQIIHQLGLKSARELMRQKEPAFRENGLDNPALSEAELIAALERWPILMERPIVTLGHRAAIGRPPEAALRILELA
jgi:arsenate reductase